MTPLPAIPLLLGLAALLAQSGGQGGAPPPGSAAQGAPVQVRRQLESSTLLPGQPRSEGEVVLDAPRPVGAPLLVDSQPLAADAVIASETLELAALHFRLAGPVALGPPFNTVFPAGTDVRRMVRDGAIRHCVHQTGVYTPAFDEHHDIYPGLCLEDRDQDGRYETAILEPYNPERAPDRTIGITPVRLDPNPSAAADDRNVLKVNRRLRVAHVGAGEAVVVAEQGIVLSRQAEIDNYRSRPQDSLSLHLRDGASGSLGGVQLRLLRDGAGWRIAATGRLAPWLEVRDNSNLILVGGMEFRRRPPSPAPVTTTVVGPAADRPRPNP